VFLYSNFESKIKFAPITCGDSGKLKTFAIFQAQFREEGNCTSAYIDFACDTRTTSGIVFWKDNVGTGGAQINLSGWGSIPWELLRGEKVSL